MDVGHLGKAVGRSTRDFLRVTAFLLLVGLCAGYPLVQTLLQIDVSENAPPLPFERYGWWLLLAVFGVLALAYAGRKATERIGSARVFAVFAVLCVAAGVGLGAWFMHRQRMRPLAGQEWRILADRVSFAPRRVTWTLAGLGCAALGARWRLANRIELETRTEDLRRHGTDTRYWVGPDLDPSGWAWCYAPGEAGGTFRKTEPRESHLALCMFEAPEGSR